MKKNLILITLIALQSCFISAIEMHNPFASPKWYPKAAQYSKIAMRFGAKSTFIGLGLMAIDWAASMDHYRNLRGYERYQRDGRTLSYNDVAPADRTLIGKLGFAGASLGVSSIFLGLVGTWYAVLCKYIDI